MGYTHYFRQSRPFTAQEWEKLSLEAGRILTAASKSINLRGGDGDGQWEIDADAICFNGDAETGDDHETLLLERAPVNPPYRANDRETFNFCKTAQKPYDAAVTSVLFAAQQIAPDAIKLSSDGGSEVFTAQF